jgi:hypothetical protein
MKKIFKFIKIILLLDLFIMLIFDIFAIISFCVNFHLIMMFYFEFGYFFYIFTLIKCSFGVILIIINIIRKKQWILKKIFYICYQQY